MRSFMKQSTGATRKPKTEPVGEVWRDLSMCRHDERRSNHCGSSSSDVGPETMLRPFSVRKWGAGGNESTGLMSGLERPLQPSIHDFRRNGDPGDCVPDWFTTWARLGPVDEVLRPAMKCLENAAFSSR